MVLELELQEYPKEIVLKDGSVCVLRPLQRGDEADFHQFLVGIPDQERMFIKDRVTEPRVIRQWCKNIDLERNLPLVALMDRKIVGEGNLRQELGGWKRHIGRINVMVLPWYRGRGLARALLNEVISLARGLGLERIEAEFIGEQQAAITTMALLGFSKLLRLEDYVLDMQALRHDYILMGLDLKTEEEYAGCG